MKTKLRVWHFKNMPSTPEYHNVETIEEGKTLIEKLISTDLKDSDVITNAFGLEVFEDGEWCEYYNDMGEDILEIIDK